MGPTSPSPPTGAFVRAVREGRVAQPNSRRFTPEAWEAAYRSIPTPARDDEALFVAGTVVHLLLDGVRAQVAAVGPLPLPRPKAAHLLTGLANREVWQAMQLFNVGVQRRVEDSGVFVQSVITERVVRSMTGEDLDIGQAVEVTLDGVVHPLRAAVGTRGARVPQPPPGEGPAAIQAASYLYVLGQLYTLVEHVWRRCAYQGLVVDVEGEALVFAPGDRRAALRQSGAEHRRDEVLMQTARQAEAELSGNLGLRRLALDRRVLCRVGRQPPYRVRVTNRPRAQGAGHDLTWWLKARIMSGQTLPPSLLAAPLDSYGGLSASILLLGLEALQPVAEQMSAELDHPPVIETAEQMCAFAPTLSAASLVAGWRRALDLTGAQAGALLDALTFRGGPRETLWFRPVVPVGPDTVALVLSAITSPNVQWLLEHWLGSGGLDLDARGPEFEALARAELRRALVGGALRDAHVVDGPFVLAGRPAVAGDPTEEEVDLLVRIGDRVLVGEVKCSLFAADDSVATCNYRSTLGGAAHQAKRKAAFLAANAEAVAVRLGLEGRYRAGDIEFVPVVVTNQPEGVGQPVGGIPVTDVSLLRQYLEYGYTLSWATLEPDGWTSGTRVPFYGTEAEAAANVRAYLTDPPQLAVYEPYAHEVDFELPSIGGRRIVYRRLVVENLPSAAPDERAATSSADA